MKIAAALPEAENRKRGRFWRDWGLTKQRGAWGG